MNRRQFFQTSAGAAALLAMRGRAYAFAQSDQLQKFVQPMRGIGPTGGGNSVTIPVAIPDAAGAPVTRVPHYTINIEEFTDTLHPNLGLTTLWGYTQTGVTPTHLGSVIAVVKSNTGPAPIQITFQNILPMVAPASRRTVHPIPVDMSSIFFDASHRQNTTAVHAHGGFVPWISDGGPFDDFGPDGTHGLSFLNNVLNPGAALNQAEYYYPNDQSARLMWYHDHAHDLTRINAYAGIASGYVIADPAELALTTQIPGPLDPKTFYMVFQDKIFVPTNIATIDPSWLTNGPGTGPGNLWYPHVYDTARWGALGPTPNGAPPDPSCIPEMFGDTILVNGLVSPYIEVEPRRYRFRMLNACNARFLNPKLVYAAGPNFPNSTEPSTTDGPPFLQIGNEGGFLPAPTFVNAKGMPRLLLAPAERADMIVDFSAVPAGSILILYSDAPAPFPRGDARNDYFPQNPKTPSAVPGFSPATRTLLQIRVKARVGSADPPLTLSLPALAPTPLVTQTPGVPTPIPTTGVTRVRQLTLNETFDGWGRLIQYIGTNVVTNLGGPGQFGRQYMDTPTETPNFGDVEVWQIANLTGDTHPIHIHLVNCQILFRQPFSVKSYAGAANLTSQPIAPDPNELGWKETVRMNPGEVTTVIMRFDKPLIKDNNGNLVTTHNPSGPNITAGVSPPSPRTGNHEYVYHCHILEHEEHDMMRPLVVT